MKKFDITLDLLTRMHIGHHQLGFIRLTRRYLPARVMTHAMTAVITQFLFDRPRPSDFLQMVLPFVKQRLKFTYFFLSEGETDYLPRYKEAQLFYGDMTESEFNQRFIYSMQSTAIDYASQSARDATLHEMEFISPASADGKRTALKGYLFVDEGEDSGMSLRIEGGDIRVSHASNSVNLSEAFDYLQLGGDRKYGCGRVRLLSDLRSTDRTKMFDTAFDVDYAGGGLRFSSIDPGNSFLPAHLKLRPGNSPLRAGSVEPVLGREYREHDDGERGGFGLNLTVGRVGAVPGSRVDVGKSQIFEADDDGMWQILQ